MSSQKQLEEYAIERLRKAKLSYVLSIKIGKIQTVMQKLEYPLIEVQAKEDVLFKDNNFVVMTYGWNNSKNKVNVAFMVSNTKPTKIVIYNYKHLGYGLTIHKELQYTNVVPEQLLTDSIESLNVCLDKFNELSKQFSKKL